MELIETYRSGYFTFQVGADLAKLQPQLDKINYGHRLFTSLPILPDIAAKLEKEVLIASLHGTDTIEGGTLTEDEILQVIESAPEITQDEHKRRITNLTQAYRFAESQAMLEEHKDFFTVSQMFILTLHKLITDGIKDEHYLPGQYRDNPKGIITKVGDVDHGGIYKPPQAHKDIKLLMDKLVEWLNSAAISALPSLIRAPLAHYYFERIHPFQDGNGRVGRLLEKSILLASGDKYTAKGVDRYYLENIDEYFSLFNQARKLETSAPDVCNQGFIGFVLKGFEITLERLHLRANYLVQHFLVLAWLGELLREKRINSRTHAVLSYLSSTQPMTLQQIKKLSWYQEIYRKLSASTESRDWGDLFSHLIIVKSNDDLILLNAFVKP